MVNRYTLSNISFISKTFKIDDKNIESIYNAFPTKKLPIITLENNNVKFEYWGSTDKFSKNLINWSPSTELEDGIKITVEWHMENNNV